MANYSEQELKQAHIHSDQHRDEVLKSNKCGCFYCKSTFTPAEIKEWIADDSCALCPKCGIDSVIGDASGLPVTDKKFLKEMHKYWFK